MVSKLHFLGELSF